MKNFKELEKAIINQQKLTTELKDKYRKVYKEYRLASSGEIYTIEVMLSNSQIEYHCAEAILESLQDAMKKLQEIEKDIHPYIF